MNTASANSNRYDETDLDETGPAEAWVARLNAPDSDGQDRATDGGQDGERA